MINKTSRCDHVAIMKPSLHLIPKILSKEKSIESRWYVNRISPWDRIKQGDTVYFKDSGKLITAVAEVGKVLQFELSSIEDGKKVVKRYLRELCFNDKAITDTQWLSGKNYAILIFLKNPREVTPFQINKTGFGSACAWLTIDDIDTIKIA